MQIEKSTSNVYPYSEKPTDEADVDLTGGEVSNVTWSQGEREGEACVRSVQCDLSKILQGITHTCSSNHAMNGPHKMSLQR